MPIIYRCCSCTDNKMIDAPEAISENGLLPNGFVHATEAIREVSGYRILCSSCNAEYTKAEQHIKAAMRPYVLLELAYELGTIQWYMQQDGAILNLNAIPEWVAGHQVSE